MTEGDMKKTNMRFSLVCTMALGLMLSGTSAQGNALTHYVRYVLTPHIHILFHSTGQNDGEKWSKKYFYLIRIVHKKWHSSKYAWPEPNCIQVSGWWQIPPQNQSTYLGGPEYLSIEIPPFRPHFIKFSKIVFYEVNLVSQCSHL